jgi:hypothetical protein
MDDRTEERILEKARYIVDAIEVLAAQRDELSFDEYEHSRTDRDSDLSGPESPRPAPCSGENLVRNRLESPRPARGC